MNDREISPFGLHGKRILVTGASSGIGRAVAVSCARAGANLVITGRDESRLIATLNAMSGNGHAAVIADLTDAAQVSSLIEQSGAVDGIVHSAGIVGVMPFRMLGRPFLDEVFDTNFVAPILLTQQLLARKRVVDGGSILFMTSLAAHTGTVGVATYSASKTALLGAIRCLALEVAKRGIRVNSLSPGLVATPILGETLAWLEEKAKMYPLGLGQPDDIANATQFFLSNASRKITGVSFNIDGGVPFTY